MTRFRPCIDLHAGQVKQIVGGTLTTTTSSLPTTNHISPLPAAHFAALYRQHAMHGGHVIMLGPGNESAALSALTAWPGGLQVGGGITDANARRWLDAGAAKVIITSFLFPHASFSPARLSTLLASLDHNPAHLVLDLSCRRLDTTYYVATDKWQTITDFEITAANLALLTPFCSDLLIHAADAEGLQAGIDAELVRRLAAWCPAGVGVTYAGGANGLEDLELVREISGGRVDLTIGSALDIFGGGGVRFEECVRWNEREEEREREREGRGEREGGEGGERGEGGKGVKTRAMGGED